MRQPKLLDRSSKVLLRFALPALLHLAGADLRGKSVHQRNVAGNLPEHQADLV